MELFHLKDPMRLMQKTYLFPVQIGMPLANASKICSIYGSVLFLTIGVPDLASRIRDVVLVRAYLAQENPGGVGKLEWGGNGEGMERGRSAYKQPGTKVDGILSRQGGFPSK